MLARLLTRAMYSLLFAVVFAIAIPGGWAAVGSRAQSIQAGKGPVSTGHPNQANPLQALDSQPARRDRDPDDPMFKTERPLPSAQLPEDLSANNWTNVYPWTNVVSAVSATEVWVGGDYGHLARFTNGIWTAVDPLSLRGGYLYDLNMLSSTSGWTILEEKPFYYDGSAWVEKSNGLTDFHMHRLSAVSANNVWAVGYSGVNNDTLMHWDGTTWAAVPIPETTGCWLCDVSFLNSAEGWAALGNNVYHYLNGTWMPVATTPDNADIEYAMALPGELWATAFNVILRYDVASATWTSWPLPASTELNGIHMASSTQGWAASTQSIFGWDGTNWTTEYQGDVLWDISGVGDQVWAVGGGGTILHRVSSTLWEKQRGGPTSNHINAVVMTDTDNGWAVARATVGYDRILLRYTAGAWGVYTSTLATNTLNDIQMLSPNDGYAVGNGVIARWDGVSWTPMPISGPMTMFFGVHMLSSQEGWAVGTATSSGGTGRIFHLAGGQWTEQFSLTARFLRTVHMDSSEHGWAAGGYFGDGLLLEYTGGTWIDRTNTLPTPDLYIRDLLFNPGGAEGWAVGWTVDNDTQAILHYLDGNWSSEGSLGQSGYTSLAREALGELWAVSCNAEHRVGATWQPVTLPNQWCLYGVSLTPGRGGWAVGPYGTILQYSPLAPGQRYYDVPTDNTFYSYIECMATRGIISGYADNTFHPNSNITRGQLSKVVSNSAGFSDPPGAQIFEGVPPGSPFYDWIQRLASRGFIGGYPCGGAGEPCNPGNRPYFRPDNDTTRAQITKIVSNTAGFVDPPGAQLFEDVPPTHGFYQWVQRLASRGIMGGYQCGGENEPCGTNNLPYFRPNNNATRGQVSKIVTNTFFPNCQNQ
jgi:hypothetical protein